MRNWYAAHDDLVEGCSCAYCRNFRAALPILTAGVQAFLAPMGLLLERSAEVMKWCKEEGGRHWDAVMYHLVENVLEEKREPVEIASGVTVVFGTDSGPFLEKFPKPFFSCFWMFAFCGGWKKRWMEGNLFYRRNNNERII